MKFAVLLYGQPRFLEASKSRILKEFTLEGHTFDFFIHFWDQIGYCPTCDKNNDYIIMPDLELCINDIKPKAYKITDYTDLDNLIFQFKNILSFLKTSIVRNKKYNTGARDTFGQHLSLRNAFSLMCSYEKKHNFKYDAVIKSRPDFIFEDENCYPSKEKYLKTKTNNYVLDVEKYGNNIVYATGLATQKYDLNTKQWNNCTLQLYDPSNVHILRNKYNALRMSDVGLCCSRLAANAYYNKWFDTYLSLFLEDNELQLFRRHDTVQGEIALLNKITVKRVPKIRYHRLIYKNKIKNKWLKPDVIILEENTTNYEEQISRQLF
jgi:hypothetical protein